MANYILDEFQGEQPLVRVAGLEYKLRYPTVKEIEDMQNLKTEQEKTDLMYSFVEPNAEGMPTFKETLETQDIRVLKAFVEMVQTEFGIEK